MNIIETASFIAAVERYRKNNSLLLYSLEYFADMRSKEKQSLLLLTASDSYIDGDESW